MGCVSGGFSIMLELTLPSHILGGLVELVGGRSVINWAFQHFNAEIVSKLLVNYSRLTQIS